MYKNINIEELKQRISNNPEAIVLDVRTPLEWEEGIIPNAKLMNIMSGTFMDDIQTLDKNAEYLLVCRSGNRSGTACSVMEAQGFSNVSNVMGGMMSWNGELASVQNA